MAPAPQPNPFLIRDCALASLAVGRRAQNLRELRDHIREVDINSIYYHFWAGLLRPRFDDPEYSNDFAAWARHALHDVALAERLAVIDPAAFANLEELRAELLDVLDEEIDRLDIPPWAPRQEQFHFVLGQLVVFDTGRRVERPEEFPAILPTLSMGSIYYHVIDARRRTPHQRVDDFRVWLAACGARYATLNARLATIDPYFTSLAELRRTLTAAFQSHFAGDDR